MATVAILPERTGSIASSVVNSSSSTIAGVAAVAGQVVRVYKLFLVAAGATNITFEDGANAISGPIALAANEAIVLDIDGTPWFTTSSGNAFNIANSGTVAIGGVVYYMQTNT